MFGNIVLYSWPVVVAILFRSCSKPVALLASVIAGYLLLPTQIELDLPVLPSLNKNTIPSMAAFFIVLVMGTRSDAVLLKGWLPRGVLSKALLLALVAGTVLTVITNRDPLIYGPTFLPALRLWDAFSTVLTVLVSLLPFFLGRKLLAHPDQQRLILMALVIAGSFYSLLALYEVRMSPQLNYMVYGFFPSSWLQAMRGDGFRPLVFLNHGLWLAIFLSATILAAFGMMRISKNTGKFIYLGIGLWLLMTLILTKSLGALTITLLLTPVVVLLRTERQLKIVAVLASIVLTYPMLRGADLVPVDRIMEWAQGISAERAESLGFRLFNEEAFLEKAEQRPLFGWGGWARNFVFDEDGTALNTVTDGYWILIIGQGGWIRYLAEFGLLCFPAILAAVHARRYRLGLESSLLAIILVGNLIDLIPNATITPLTWMIAGAVWGRLELGQISQSEDVHPQTPQHSRRLVYSRPPAETAAARTESQSLPIPSPPKALRYTRQENRIKRSIPDQASKPEEQ